jgi:four helix bundle protein
MRDAETNAVLMKSFAFAVRCVNLRKYLIKEKGEYDMSKQLLRCGTSIGANIKEALRGQTRPDFGTKMNISLKEASESEYWIELLQATEYLTPEQGDNLLKDCRELIKLLTSIVKTTFAKVDEAGCVA